MRDSARSITLALALSAAAALAAAQAAAPRPAREEPVAVRDGLEALEARLDRAVDRVSLPHAARLLGRAESARAYRLPGYGVVLVLTPRALPGASGRIYFLQRGRGGRVHVQTHTQAPPAPGAPGTFVADLAGDEGVETFERQVLVLQQETEAARRAAEEEMERIVHDVRVRVAVPAVPQPAPPQPPQPPQPPGAPEPLAPPPPPPWKFWFDIGSGAPTDARSPDAVVADVRAALIESLTAPGATSGLAGDERVTVAVDFVEGGLFVANARADRTLLVSVRARDVAARARGAISVEELRRRVEIGRAHV